MNPYKTVRVKSKRFCHVCGSELERMNGGMWSCNNPECNVWSVRLTHDGAMVSTKFIAEPITQ